MERAGRLGSGAQGGLLRSVKILKWKIGDQRISTLTYYSHMIDCFFTPPLRIYVLVTYLLPANLVTHCLFSPVGYYSMYVKN